MISISKCRPFHPDRVTLLPKLPPIFNVPKRWGGECPVDRCCKTKPAESPCEKKKAPCPTDPCALDPAFPQPKVLIIGAGLAGLSAANRLTQCGFRNFEIIEASDRPGGRIHSCWLGDDVGELGAGYINYATVANPVFALGAQEGLLKDPLAWRREPPISRTPYLSSDGRAIDRNIVVPAVKLFNRIKHQAFSLFSMGNNKEQGTLQEFFKKRLEEQLKLLPAEWRSDAWRVISGMINRMKSRWGTHIKNMSSDMYGSVVLLPGGDLRIPVGLVGILGPLMKNLTPGNIRYCSPVQEITWKGCKPRVTLKLCNDTITGDYAIVTVSLGVLKNSEKLFAPELPDWKKLAIKKLGYGKMTRIIMEYKQPFWLLSEGLIRFCWSEKELETRDSWSKGVSEIEDMPGTSNKLLTTIGGEETEMLEGCCDEDIAEEITRLLRQFTGNPSIPYPTGIVRSNWNKSNFFMGSNSFIAEGSTVNDQCTLGTPLPGPNEPGPPIVLFAGEATMPGYVNSLLGAHLSGIREADRILKLTNKYRGPPPLEHISK